MPVISQYTLRTWSKILANFNINVINSVPFHSCIIWGLDCTLDVIVVVSHQPTSKPLIWVAFSKKKTKKLQILQRWLSSGSWGTVQPYAYPLPANAYPQHFVIEPVCIWGDSLCVWRRWFIHTSTKSILAIWMRAITI